MRVLGVNTVADVCEAALVDGARVLAHIAEPMTQGHDARLAPIVDSVMRQSGVDLHELDRVAVIVGPGSFTGVRVGVSFARALAMALQIRVAGVSSLEALEGLPQSGRVLGVLAAKRRPPQLSWWVQQLADGRGVEEPGEAEAAGVIELAVAVDAICGQADGLPVAVPVVAARPSAIAAAQFAARLGDDHLPPARPIYVREPDAAPMKPGRT